MKLGLQQQDIDHIIEALRRAPEVRQAIVFGSRAKGDCVAGSDIDLAVKGRTITDQTLSTLKTLLEEEAPLPYFFDIVHYERIRNKKLIEHINRVGQIIYSK